MDRVVIEIAHRDSSSSQHHAEQEKNVQFLRVPPATQYVVVDELPAGAIPVGEVPSIYPQYAPEINPNEYGDENATLLQKF